MKVTVFTNVHTFSIEMYLPVIFQQICGIFGMEMKISKMLSTYFILSFTSKYKYQ